MLVATSIWNIHHNPGRILSTATTQVSRKKRKAQLKSYEEPTTEATADAGQEQGHTMSNASSDNVFAKRQPQSHLNQLL
jgi:hypothetical protein